MLILNRKGRVMERHLNLIKSQVNTEEKRVLPRFPFCFMTFKMKDVSRALEVVDISFSGMKAELKVGELDVKELQEITGQVHWNKGQVDIRGRVVWVNKNAMGIEFSNDAKFKDGLAKFLSIENIVSNFKPLHRPEFDLEIPRNLKYWFRADGPLEFFVWEHNDGELSKIQFVLMENFVEWEDGQGLKTGTVASKKSVDTPLHNKDEYVFEIDAQVNSSTVRFANSIIELLGEGEVEDDARRFIQRKLAPALNS